MEDGKEDVGGEGALDCYLVFQLVLAFEFLGQADVLVDGLEPAFYILILCFVEVLEFLCFVGFFVEGEGAIAIAFAGCVGADEVKFVAGLPLAGELVGVVLESVLWWV